MLINPVWTVPVVVLAVSLAGCSGLPEPAPAADVPVIAGPPEEVARDPAPQREIREVYGGLWQNSWRLQDQPRAEWGSVLERSAADPLREQLLERKQQDQQTGTRLWGRVTTHIRDIEVRGKGATVLDCQDSSQAGRLEASGAKTVGVARNPVTAQLDRTPAGWRVTAVAYPGGGC